MVQFIIPKNYNSLGDACQDLQASLIKISGYKDEMGRWVQVAQLVPKDRSNDFYYLETEDGVWGTQITPSGLDCIRSLPVYNSRGKNTSDFYNFVTKHNLTYDDIIKVVDDHEVTYHSITITKYLSKLAEV